MKAWGIETDSNNYIKFISGFNWSLFGLFIKFVILISIFLITVFVFKSLDRIKAFTWKLFSISFYFKLFSGFLAYKFIFYKKSPMWTPTNLFQRLRMYQFPLSTYSFQYFVESLPSTLKWS